MSIQLNLTITNSTIYFFLKIIPSVYYTVYILPRAKTFLMFLYLLLPSYIVIYQIKTSSIDLLKQ